MIIEAAMILGYLLSGFVLGWKLHTLVHRKK